MSTDHAKEYAKHSKRDSGCLIWVFVLVVLTWIGIPVYIYVMEWLMSDYQVKPPAETQHATSDSN